MADTAAVAQRVIAAYPVLRHGVGVRAGAQGDATASAAEPTVEHHLVVVDRQVVIVAVRVGAAGIGLLREERVPHPDTAAEEAAVVCDAVVGDLQVVGIAVGDDAAAGVRALDGEAVDAGFSVVARVVAIESLDIERLVARGLGEHQHAGALLVP